MRKRETELLEEIEALKTKLKHAEDWMTRQVEESPSANHHFFARLHRPINPLEQVGMWIDRIKHFHPFRHRPSFIEIWQKRLEAFLVGAAIILFWRGIWNLADHYLFPGHSNISAFSSLFIGMGLMILTRSFVNQFLDDAVEEAD